MVRKKRKKITNKKELCKMCYKPIEYHASRKQHALCAYLQALKRSEKFSKSGIKSSQISFIIPYRV